MTIPKNYSFFFILKGGGGGFFARIKNESDAAPDGKKNIKKGRKGFK